MALADGGAVGVITACHDGSVAFYPEDELRATVNDSRLSAQSRDALPAQWPLVRFDSHRAMQAQRALVAAMQDSTTRASSAPDVPPPVPASGQAQLSVSSLVFPESAKRWLVDFSAIKLIRVIGEGAFGTVWLGRW